MKISRRNFIIRISAFLSAGLAGILSPYTARRTSTPAEAMPGGHVPPGDQFSTNGAVAPHAGAWIET